MNGVLTEAQKAEVVARYMAGETMTYLADQYSVTRPAIRGILLRRKVPLRRLAKLTEQQKAEVVGVVDGDGSIGCYSGRWQFRLCGQARLLMPFTQFLVARNMSRLSVRPHTSITALGTTGRPAERIIDLLYHGAGQAVLDRKAATAARVIDRLNNLVGE